MGKGKCPLCDQECSCDETLRDNRFWITYTCDICGKYIMEDYVSETLIYKEDVRPHRYLLSGISRNSDKNFKFTQEYFKNLSFSQIKKEPIEQIDHILTYIYKKEGIKSILLDHWKDYPIAYSKDGNEFSNLLKIAFNEGYLSRDLRRDSGVYEYNLKWKALERLRDIKKMRREYNQAVVAMSFNPELTEAWEKGIRSALEETGYKPKRLDYEDYKEKIDDKLIAEIRKSSLLIADFTFNSKGVYFEAGFAMGLDINVLWTCRKNHTKDIHADTRQYPYIQWETWEELKEKLKNRIERLYPVR